MNQPDAPTPNAPPSEPRNPSKRRPALGWTLVALFALAMLMGTGPGLLLVNRPDSLLGLPLLYVWGLFWYAVQVVVIVTAYVVFWRQDEERS